MALPVPRRGSGTLDRRTVTVTPDRISASDALVTVVEERLAVLIEGCAEFATPDPPGCPFATDGKVDTPDGQRVESLHDLSWSVLEYPQISLVDDRRDNGPAGFLVVMENPGSVRLSGSGTNTDRVPGTFGVDCAIEIDGWLRVTMRPDGAVELDAGPLFQRGNTCYRQP